VSFIEVLSRRHDGRKWYFDTVIRPGDDQALAANTAVELQLKPPTRGPCPASPQVAGRRVGITTADLLAGARREYRKAGRLVPDGGGW
jgi:hypothetical protein